MQKPKSGAFKTESGLPPRADADAAAYMFRRLMAMEFNDLPFEYQAGPYWMKADENGNISMGLATAECLITKLST